MGEGERTWSGALKVRLEIIALIIVIAEAIRRGVGQLRQGNTGILTIILVSIVGISCLVLVFIFLRKKSRWARRSATIGVIVILVAVAVYITIQ